MSEVENALPWPRNDVIAQDSRCRLTGLKNRAVGVDDGYNIQPVLEQELEVFGPQVRLVSRCM